MAKPDLELRTGEQIIHNGLMSYVRSKIHIQGGSAYLTTQRFMRFQQNTKVQVLIGVFAFLLKEKPDFEIELSEIQSIRRGKQGINKNVILLKTTDGTEYKLICKKFDEWMAAFQTVYEGFPHHKMFMIAQEQWAVQVAQNS